MGVTPFKPSINLSLFFSYSCALFGTAKNSTLFLSIISALFTPKHPGWGEGAFCMISQFSSREARTPRRNYFVFTSGSANSATSATSPLIPLSSFTFQLSTLNLSVPYPCFSFPRTRSSTSSIFSPSRWSFRARP
jgi:hypothetical protein